MQGEVLGCWRVGASAEDNGWGANGVGADEGGEVLRVLMPRGWVQVNRVRVLGSMPQVQILGVQVLGVTWVLKMWVQVLGC